MIDLSDGLVSELYHLSHASKVSMLIENLPIHYDIKRLSKKEKLKSAGEADSKGGGIGFIEMIRRTGSKLIMNKEFPTDENLTLELIFNYKSGENNG